MESPETRALKSKILAAALVHVPFDGWSASTLRAALRDAGCDPSLGASLFPRGAVDLALAFHRQGDAALLTHLRQTDLSEMRFRDRIAYAVRHRLTLVENDKEAVRRGATLFALPIHAADGARAIWETADVIWDGLGDPSDDFNWYSKRATLSAVYSATVLYWLGDTSEDHRATWEFLDRRIEGVMQFEGMKKKLSQNPIARRFMAGPEWVLSKIKAPAKMPRVDLPGYLRPEGDNPNP